LLSALVQTIPIKSFANGACFYVLLLMDIFQVLSADTMCNTSQQGKSRCENQFATDAVLMILLYIRFNVKYKLFGKANFYHSLIYNDYSSYAGPGEQTAV